MSIDPVLIADSYGSSVRPKLMEQYKPHHAPKLNALLEAVCSQKDDLEAALFSIRSGFYLETACCEQLDYLGTLFNVDRAGRDDDTYRIAIKQVAALRSFATPEDIISVLKGVYGATFVTYIPEYPAGCAILTDADVTQAILELIAPAGVQVRGSSFIVDYDGNNIVDYDGNLLYGAS